MSTGEHEGLPLRWRLSLQFHLVMCRHCRAFARQLTDPGVLARRANQTTDEEPGREFEERITRRLVGR